MGKIALGDLILEPKMEAADIQVEAQTRQEEGQNEINLTFDVEKMPLSVRQIVARLTFILVAATSSNKLWDTVWDPSYDFSSEREDGLVDAIPGTGNGYYRRAEILHKYFQSDNQTDETSKESTDLAPNDQALIYRFRFDYCRFNSYTRKAWTTLLSDLIVRNTRSAYANGKVTMEEIQELSMATNIPEEWMTEADNELEYERLLPSVIKDIVDAAKERDVFMAHAIDIVKDVVIESIFPKAQEDHNSRRPTPLETFFEYNGDYRIARYLGFRKIVQLLQGYPQLRDVRFVDFIDYARETGILTPDMALGMKISIEKELGLEEISQYRSASFFETTIDKLTQKNRAQLWEVLRQTDLLPSQILSLTDTEKDMDTQVLLDAISQNRRTWDRETETRAKKVKEGITALLGKVEGVNGMPDLAKALKTIDVLFDGFFLQTDGSRNIQHLFGGITEGHWRTTDDKIRKYLKDEFGSDFVVSDRILTLLDKVELFARIFLIINCLQGVTSIVNVKTDFALENSIAEVITDVDAGRIIFSPQAVKVGGFLLENHFSHEIETSEINPNYRPSQAIIEDAVLNFQARYPESQVVYRRSSEYASLADHIQTFNTRWSNSDLPSYYAGFLVDAATMPLLLRVVDWALQTEGLSDGFTATDLMRETARVFDRGYEWPNPAITDIVEFRRWNSSSPDGFFVPGSGFERRRSELFGSTPADDQPPRQWLVEEMRVLRKYVETKSRELLMEPVSVSEVIYYFLEKGDSLDEAITDTGIFLKFVSRANLDTGSHEPNVIGTRWVSTYILDEFTLRGYSFNDQTKFSGSWNWYCSLDDPNCDKGRDLGAAIGVAYHLIEAVAALRDLPPEVVGAGALGLEVKEQKSHGPSKLAAEMHNIQALEAIDKYLQSFMNIR